MRSRSARVLPNQLQHSRTLMYRLHAPGGLRGPRGQTRRAVRRPTRTTGREPGKPTYDSIDLSQFLQSTGRRRNAGCSCSTRAGASRMRGLNRPAAQNEARTANTSATTSRGQLEDARLILVTDLGFIVKRAKDGSRDVFVQSIRTGLPVAGARVNVVGINGQPVMSGDDRRDRPRPAAAPPRDLPAREAAADGRWSQKDADMSFLPFSAQRPRLDVSRFDAGGVDNARVGRSSCRAYLFSDRGIYRPGETDAPRADRHADRRLEGVTRRAAAGSSRSPIRAALVVSSTAAQALGAAPSMRSRYTQPRGRADRHLPGHCLPGEGRDGAASCSARRRSRCRSSSRTA